MFNEITATKIRNSRGEATIEVSVVTKAGKVAASAPSGKSRGKHEAQPFSSRGLDFSISFVNALGKQLTKLAIESFSDLEKIEQLARRYDKSANWNLIGANALYALEAALLKAAAASEGKELWQWLNPEAAKLPRPLGNCIGGGMHAKGVRTDFQEFLLLPKTRHFFDAYFINLQAYKEAKRQLSARDKAWQGQLTDEHALAATLSVEEVLELLCSVATTIKERFGITLRLGIDVAALTLWNGVNYSYSNPKKRLSKEQQLDYIAELVKKYKLAYVEDPFAEDFTAFAQLLRLTKTMVTADDLVCTQRKLLEKAIGLGAINGLIIKPNQNGSLLETKAIVDIAQKHDIVTVISHRSGETSDNTIADLAVAWNCPLIKTGILGKERFAKLHRLLKIERQLSKV